MCHVNVTDMLILWETIMNIVFLKAKMILENRYKKWNHMKSLSVSSILLVLEELLKNNDTRGSCMFMILLQIIFWKTNLVQKHYSNLLYSRIAYILFQLFMEHILHPIISTKEPTKLCLKCLKKFKISWILH